LVPGFVFVFFFGQRFVCIFSVCGGSVFVDGGSLVLAGRFGGLYLYFFVVCIFSVGVSAVCIFFEAGLYFFGRLVSIFFGSFW
jgi:hypothetical protein